MGDIRKSDPMLLAGLMSLAESTPHRVWQAEELAAVMRHQLAATVRFDLTGLGAGVARQLATLSDAQDLLVKSFGDLFNHPHPPIELLVLTKDFAKASRNHPESPLPREIAMLLYFLSIAVADLRCGQRISELDDRALMRGLDWFVQQPWLEEPARTILKQELEKLMAKGEPPRG